MSCKFSQTRSDYVTKKTSTLSKVEITMIVLFFLLNHRLQQVKLNVVIVHVKSVHIAVKKQSLLVLIRRV